MKKIFIFIVCVIISNSAYANWDGSVTGKISQIQVTGGNNYGFRVVIEGSPKLCGNDHNWAYINESDSNYNTYVSVLTAAKAAKQEVKLLTTRKDGDENGYCHLGYVVVY